MPAQVYGAGGVGPGIGTFLVSYSSLTEGGAGGNEFINVIRIDNPLTSPSFHQNFVSLGDISNVGGNFGFSELEDAPQLGSSILIEVNDTRALDCVWRDNSLWLVTTINPNSGADAGQTTAHWIQLNTVTWPPTLFDQGDIGGEDIADDAFTFFPSVAVNSKGKVKFGFSASASSIYVGAYVTGREPTDPQGTVQSSQIVQAGEDFYVRTFGTPGTDRNRWGDYSGISVDPVDDELFWIFNGYAEIRGAQSGSEDGRWGTAWSTSSFEPVGIAEDSQKQFRQFTLYPNYPNPFNQSTTIRYRLASSARVSIKIYSHSGEEIRTLVNQVQSAGGKSVRWNGLDNSGMAVASGIYLYEIRTAQFREANRMLLLK
jgi:hypothetical protein